MPYLPPTGFKQAMLDGQLKLGMFLTGNNVDIAEVCGIAGFDFLVVDLEHGGRVDVASTVAVIRAADIAGKPTIVRVPECAPGIFAHVLDHGAIGVCLPHVRTRADAERAAAYARYPPRGVRAVAPGLRSFGYATDGLSDLCRTANEEVLVMVIVEDRVGLENLDEIAAVPGIDVVWIGTGDLALDMDLLDRPDHPALSDAVCEGVEAASRNGKISFTPLSPEGLDRRLIRSSVTEVAEAGFRMAAWNESSLLATVLSNLLDPAREALRDGSSAAIFDGGPSVPDRGGPPGPVDRPRREGSPRS